MLPADVQLEVLLSLGLVRAVRAEEGRLLAALELAVVPQALAVLVDVATVRADVAASSRHGPRPWPRPRPRRHPRRHWERAQPALDRAALQRYTVSAREDGERRPGD